MFDQDVATLRYVPSPPFGHGIQHLRLTCDGAHLLKSFKIDHDFLGLKHAQVNGIQPSSDIGDGSFWHVTMDIAPYASGHLDLPLSTP